MNHDGDGRVRLFNVSDPQAPDGHTVYKVVLKVFTKTSGVSTEETEVVVWKRFSQFQRLRKELVHIYNKTNRDTRDFPPFVKTSYFDRFKEQVIEERRVACLQLLQFVSSQPVLYMSKTFTQFFEGGSVMSSDSRSSLTSATSVESETSERNLAVQDTVTVGDPPDVPVDTMAATEMDPTNTDPQAMWPSVFDSPEQLRRDNHVVKTENPLNSSKQNLYNCDSVDSLVVVRIPPDGQEGNFGVVDDLVDIQPPFHSSSNQTEGGISALLAVTDTSVDRTDGKPIVEPDTFPAIDLDGLPALTVSELGDLEWPTSQDSHYSLPGHSSPLGGMWLHKQPSDVSSLSSNDGPTQDESRATIDVSELRRAISSEFEDSHLLSRKWSPSHSGFTPELDSGPVSHTSTMTSDSEAEVSRDTPDTSKSLAPSHDVVGFSAEDSWWQQALSVCDQELAEGLLDAERENTSTVGVNSSEDAITDGLPSQDCMHVIDRSESDTGEFMGQSPDMESEVPTGPQSRTTTGIPVVSQDYVAEASKTLSQAIACETQSDYQKAFDLYKLGVEMLLSGVQGEKSKTRRQMVRKKTGQYLLRAELIFKQHIKKDGRLSPWDSSQVGQLDRQPELILPQATLADFKVLGLIDNVQLVQDKQTIEVYVLKALRKTYNPQVSKRRHKGKRSSRSSSNMQVRCPPYMVQLFHHFETSSCIFLLLEYVAGGKVMNFINSRHSEIEMSEAAKHFHGLEPIRQSRVESHGNKEPETFDRGEDNLEGKELMVGAVVDHSSFGNQREEAGGEDLPAAQNPDVEESSISRQTLGSAGVSGVEFEQQVALWMAQLVRCLSSLHESGTICRDLRPDNLLLTPEGNIAVTYFGSWDNVDWQCHPGAQPGFYTAPELNGMPRASPAADWWSLGVILFELLTGRALRDCHPGGPDPYIPLNFPIKVSPAARSLIEGLLQINACERLGSGIAGVEEIMSHPFFVQIDWNTV